MASMTTKEGRDWSGWRVQTKRHLVSSAAAQGMLGLEQGANACSSPKKVFVQNWSASCGGPGRQTNLCARCLAACNIAKGLELTSRPHCLTLSLLTKLSTLQMLPTLSLPRHTQVHRHGAASCVSDLRYAISDLTLREAGRSALPTGAMNAVGIQGAAASADVEMARTSIGVFQPAPAQEEVVARSVAVCVGRHFACVSVKRACSKVACSGHLPAWRTRWVPWPESEACQGLRMV